jgi:MFS family permease
VPTAGGTGARRARAAVAVVFAANGVMFGNWAVRIPDVKLDLDLSDASLGGTLLVPAAGALVSIPLAGALCVRYGSRPATVATRHGTRHKNSVSVREQARHQPTVTACAFIQGGDGAVRAAGDEAAGDVDLPRGLLGGEPWSAP